MKTKNNLLLKVAFVSFFFCFSVLHSQEKDLGLWSTLTIEKSITEKLDFSIDEEFRLKENLSRLNLFYTNIGLNYKLNKTIKTSLIYRHVQKAQDQGYFNYKQRIMFDVIYKRKVYTLNFAYRSRFQGELSSPGASETGLVPEYYWRHKFDFKLKTKTKFTPYLGNESRLQLQNPRVNENPGFRFDRTRFYLGADYALSKNQKLGVYYLMQNDYGFNNPVTQFIIGVEYAIKLSGKNKEETVPDED